MNPIKVSIFALGCALAGCAVGPDFKRPSPTPVESFTPAPLPEETASANSPAGAAQKFIFGRDVASDWWTLYQSPQLNALVQRALKANPTVQAAQAALRQSQELVYAQRGAYYPQVEASYNGVRQRDSGAISSTVSSSNNPFTLHTAQLSVSYTPDVFGLNRRTVESLEALANAQRFELEATYLTLSTNVVAAAIQDASLRAQIASARSVIAALTKSLAILRQQFAVGYVAGLDVAAQEAALAQAEQALPPLEKQLAQNRDLLATLVGVVPAHGPSEAFELTDLRLPEELPLSLPSRLVEQRPDVRAAEEQLHSASANVGVATANMLPQFTITAARGGTAEQIGQMFAGDNPFWNLAVGVTQPIFMGGTLLHRKRAAEAAYDQAAAQYRSTVLSAFQNVADVLYAIQTDAAALEAAVKSERTAKVALDIVTKQLAVGQVNYLALLNAQQTYQQALGNLAQARYNR
ncbi:MAG: efflux transporter outer membrane subunit, partial [Betaproteobacteria bacterium]|nr:efflux transporter outer membrane subunit [Betaproteobacteria bacterium]